MSMQIQPLTFSVTLTQKAHNLAESFCSQYSNFLTSERIYLNTLSVYAVNYYLQCMGFETNPETSNSSDSILQTFIDIADLEIKGLGKLECRSVSPKDKIVYIPQEVWTERIGYIAVQFDSTLETATLLGFTEKVTTEKLTLDRLRNLAELPEYLQKIKPSIDLNQWFNEVVDKGWQTIDNLLANKSIENLALSFKDTNSQQIIKRFKQIDFGHRSIILSIALIPEEKDSISIRVRVYPLSPEKYLPEKFRLAILDESEETLKEIISRTKDNFIQLPLFTCNPGENFQIKLTCNDIIMKENFYL